MENSGQDTRYGARDGFLEQDSATPYATLHANSRPTPVSVIPSRPRFGDTLRNSAAFSPEPQCATCGDVARHMRALWLVAAQRGGNRQAVNRSSTYRRAIKS